MTNNVAYGGELDLAIRGGVVVDGTLRGSYRTDIGIRNGMIVEMGDIGADRARTVLDADGRIVGPGFVDTHTHFDVQMFADPTCADAGENGVTTVVMGNCGFGLAPCRPADRERYMLLMESVEQIPVEQQRTSLPWSWESFPEMLDAIGRTPTCVNGTMYVPLNALLIYVMGREAASTRPATAEEIAMVQNLLVEAMRGGACGLSTSALGDANVHRDHDGAAMPTDVMPVDQALEIAEGLQHFDVGVVQCLSGIPGKLDQSIITGLAEASGRPVLQNLIPTSDFSSQAHVEPLQWLDEVNRSGHDVYAASFLGRGWVEVVVGNSAVHDADPAFRELSFAPDEPARLALLRDATFRDRIRSGYNPRRFIAANGVLERFSLADPVGCQAITDSVGVPLGALAERSGKHVVDVYLDMCLASEGRAVFNCGSLGSSDPKVVSEVFLHDKVIGGGSDGGAHIQNFNGTAWTTDLLSWLVRDEGLVSVEEAHHRMSFVPSRLFGLSGRGEIAVGKAADLVVYGLDELFFDRTAYEIVPQPQGGWRKRVKAGGYRWIIVGGEVTFEDGKRTRANPGRYLAPGAPPATSAGAT